MVSKVAERLTNFAINGTSMLLHSWIKFVGHGSSRQDFTGLLSTASSDT